MKGIKIQCNSYCDEWAVFLTLIKSKPITSFSYKLVSFLFKDKQMKKLYPASDK